MSGASSWQRATQAIAAARPDGAGEPLNAPPIPASAFRAGGAIDYARKASPTASALEHALGLLDGGHAVAFGSGMGAIAATVRSLVPRGGRIVAPWDAYLGTRALLGDLEADGQLTWTRVEQDDTEATLTALGDADVLWIETPTNPLMAIADVPALVAGAGEHGARVVVDATFPTPLRLRPLEHGADVVVHSVTKLIGGHSDLLAGAAIAADPSVAEDLRLRRRLDGAVLEPQSAWLALRGLRTLEVRLDRAEANAMALAGDLAAHPAVTRVRYPGLPSDPGHERHARQAEGPGTMLAFELADAATADRVLGALRLVAHATSLGGVESTIERRGAQPGEDHLPAGLLRLSVGCEAHADLWGDLAGALDAGAEAGPRRPKDAR